jgi:hypothetical protein
MQRFRALFAPQSGPQDKAPGSDPTPGWVVLSREGRFQEAIQLCLQNVPNPLTDFTASQLLGYAYFQIGQYDQALPYLRRSVELQPSAYNSLFFLANSLLRQNSFEEAAEVFVQAHGRYPQHRAEILAHALPLLITPPMTEHKRLLIAAIEELKLGPVEGCTPDLLMRLLFFQQRDRDLLEFIRTFEGGEGGGYRLSRILSVAAAAAQSCGTYATVGERERIPHLPPSESREPTAAVTEVLSTQPYVAELHDVSVVGGSSLIFLPNGDVVSDVLADEEYGRYVNIEYDKVVVAQRLGALLVKLPAPGVKLEEAVLLSGLASNSYGHWFAEFLPKLCSFSQSDAFSGRPILVDANMPQSHYDLLRILVPNPLIEIRRGLAVHVGKLLVAPTTSFFPVELFHDHRVPPEHQSSGTVSSMRFIRDTVTRRLGAAPPQGERIFLSRRNCTWRKLVNEQEVIERLACLGFRVVFIEEFEFKEQVRIFQRAEFVVAPNGSALLNLLFCNTDVKILVLGQKAHFNWGNFNGIMRAVGYIPIFFEGDAVGDGSNKHADYHVPAEAVYDKVLAMFGDGQ